MVFFLLTAALAAPGLSHPSASKSGPARSAYAVELLPHQVWPALEGQTEGLVVEAKAHEWGSPVHWGRGPDRPNYCAYRYTTGPATSPFAVYFESSDPTVGYNHIANWSGGGGVYDAAMLCSKTGQTYGLSRPVHVVQLQVNSGDGIAENRLHFVATEAKVLDGTRAVPLDPGKALIEMRKRFDRGLAKRDGEIAGRVDAGRALALRSGEDFRQSQATEQASEPTVQVLPSWDPATQQLRATFIWSHIATVHASTTEMVAVNCPPGAPCVPPRPMTTDYFWSYGAEVAATFTVDAKGRVFDAEWHEVRGVGLSAE
ncbi:MAG: hypothetical protein KC912_05360 [Proteobacteria bacterium]|nr:hypothetical protein [Pseudomonadota bacterium]